MPSPSSERLVSLPAGVDLHARPAAQFVRTAMAFQARIAVAAGGAPDGGLGTDGTLVGAAIAAADQGDGAIVLGDLGSAILTARHVLDERVNGNGSVRLVDAPLVEGAIAAAVVASAGMSLDEVAAAAEEARAVPKF